MNTCVSCPAPSADSTIGPNENDIVIRQGAKLIRIRLTELAVEELGSLELPMQQVDFTLENTAGGAIDSFMTRWDEHKLRMGG